MALLHHASDAHLIIIIIRLPLLSHSINAIGPAPHRGGRKREHRSIMFATITHIPSLHKIRRNAPRYHPTNALATPNIIRNKTQQLGRSIRQCQYIAQLFSATSHWAQNRTNRMRICATVAHRVLLFFFFNGSVTLTDA
jgi:hypothetical protein